MMATNTCQSVSTPGVAVKATYQSKVWVGGKRGHLSNHLLSKFLSKDSPFQHSTSFYHTFILTTHKNHTTSEAFVGGKRKSFGYLTAT